MRNRRALAAVNCALGFSLITSNAAAAAFPPVPVGPGPQTTYSVRAQGTTGHCHYRHTASGQPLPDRRCTPGALNPRVTQSTIKTTICRSGYTSTIRPPEAITGQEKIADARSYGYRGPLSQAEYDHLVPLELGGDPNDPRNLWVEPPSPGHRASQTFRNPTDTVERKAKALVCDGIVSLGLMQRAIAFNWTTALISVGHPSGK